MHRLLLFTAASAQAAAWPGRARFTRLWTLGADGAWRLARIFGFAHEKAEEGAPRAAAFPIRRSR